MDTNDKYCKSYCQRIAVNVRKDNEKLRISMGCRVRCYMVIVTNILPKDN